MIRFWFLGRIDMKFEEIRHSILNEPNDYEIRHNIKTLHVECLIKKENCALFRADKSDNSQTLFYARKGKRNLLDSWQWFCPSEPEVEEVLPLLIEIYHLINEQNQKMRKFRQPLSISREA